MNAQELAWAKQFTSPDEVMVFDMALDNSGNTFTTGHFFGTIDFDPGPNTANLTAMGLSDIFVCKLDANGDFQWAAQLSGPQDEDGLGITTDPAGNVYITGQFHDFVDFDPGPGSFNLSANTINGSTPYAGFLCKLDGNGALEWARKLGSDPADITSGNAFGYDVAIDPAGSTVAVSGSFVDTLYTSPGNVVMVGHGYAVYHAYVVTFDAATGDGIWGGQIDGFSFSTADAVKLDDAGNIYLCGGFSSISDFDPTIGVHEENSIQGNDGYVLKWGPGGAFNWVRTYHGTFGDVHVDDLCLDNSGNVISTGNFNFDIDFSGAPLTATSNDAFMVKFDGNGGLQWVRQFTAVQFARGAGITTDDDGNIYSTGFYMVAVDMDPGPNVFTLDASTNSEVPYINKLSPAGDLIWAVDLEGVSGAKGYGIAVDALGSVYSAGHFRSTVDFDPQAGSYPLTAELLDNGYVHKMCQQSSSSITLTICQTEYISPSGNVYTQPGIYFDTIPNTAGCDSIITTDLSFSSHDTTVTENGSTLTAVATNVDYIWLDCNNGFAWVPGEFSQSFTPEVSGSYAVMIGVAFCFTDTSSCHTVIIEGFETPSYEPMVSARPNPTNGTFSLDLGRLYEHATVSITNVTGQTIDRRTVRSMRTIPVVIEGASGPYYVRIDADGGHTANIRVIKE